MIAQSPISMEIEGLLTQLSKISDLIVKDSAANPSIEKDATTIQAAIHILAMALTEAQAKIIANDVGLINRLVHYDHLVHQGHDYVDAMKGFIKPMQEGANAH